MELTKEQWQEFKDVQESGEYNMYDPAAVKSTTLSIDEWLYIMKNYSCLEGKYGEATK